MFAVTTSDEQHHQSATKNQPPPQRSTQDTTIFAVMSRKKWAAKTALDSEIQAISDRINENCGNDREERGRRVVSDRGPGGNSSKSALTEKMKERWVPIISLSLCSISI